MKFLDLNKYMIDRFMFRYHINDIPHIFEGHFSKISDIHDYRTRSNEGFYAKHVKSDFLQNLYFLQRSSYLEHD